MTYVAEVEDIIRAAFQYEHSTQLREQFQLQRSLSCKVSSLYQKFQQGDAETAYELSRECATSMVTIMSQYHENNPAKLRVRSKFITILEEVLVLLRRHCSKEEFNLLRLRLFDNTPWPKLDPRFGAQANKRHYLRVLNRELKRRRFMDTIKPLLL